MPNTIKISLIEGNSKAVEMGGSCRDSFMRKNLRIKYA